MRLKANLLKLKQDKNKMKPPMLVRTPIKAVFTDYQTIVLPSRDEIYIITDWYRLNDGQPIYYQLTMPVPMDYPDLIPNVIGELLEIRKKHWWEL